MEASQQSLGVAMAFTFIAAASWALLISIRRSPRTRENMRRAMPFSYGKFLGLYFAAPIATITAIVTWIQMIRGT